MYIAVEYKEFRGYIGFDLETIEAHPQDGSDGFMLVFFSDKEGFNYEELDRIDKIENPHLCLFCCSKEQDPETELIRYMRALEDKMNEQPNWFALAGPNRGKII